MPNSHTPVIALCLCLAGFARADVICQHTVKFEVGQTQFYVCDEIVLGTACELRLDQAPPEYGANRQMLGTAATTERARSASASTSLALDNPLEYNQYEFSYAFSSSWVSFDDFVISGPPGVVEVSFHTRLAGTQFLSANSSTLAGSVVQVIFALNHDPFSGGYHGLSIYHDQQFVDEGGVLLGFGGNDVLRSDAFSVATNTPFGLSLYLDTSAMVLPTDNGFCSGTAETRFENTLAFPTDRPVFNLPAGYTVNSVQAGIINNTFSRPCPADFNLDSRVDDADFTTFAAGYTILDCADPSMTAGCPADIDADGFVDDSDFTVFAVAYNEMLCP